MHFLKISFDAVRPVGSKFDASATLFFKKKKDYVGPAQTGWHETRQWAESSKRVDCICNFDVARTRVYCTVSVSRPEKLGLVSAIEMEVIDCASDVLRSVTVTSSNKEAFADADIIILLEEDWQVSAKLRCYLEKAPYLTSLVFKKMAAFVNAKSSPASFWGTAAHIR